MRRLASDCCKPPHHRSRHSLPRSIRSSSPRLHAPATHAAIENDAAPIAAAHGRPVQYSQDHAYGQEAPTPPPVPSSPRGRGLVEPYRPLGPLPPRTVRAVARLGPRPVADGHLVDVAAIAAPPYEFAAYGLHADGLQALVHASSLHTSPSDVFVDRYHKTPNRKRSQ